jgi:CRP/FNR family transcriptional regulator, dissimilatory nitrate respiration regulator
MPYDSGMETREINDAELRRTYLFAGLSEQHLNRIKQTARVIKLGENERLFDHGQHADRFFLVRSGQIKLFRLSVGGVEKVIEIIRPRQTFAEAVMFMEGQNYPVNAEAIEPSEVISFDSKTFLQLLRESSEACFRLMADMSQRLHGRLDEIDHLTLQNATYRLISYLLHQLDEAAQGATDIHLATPKSVIASRLSIQPETFSRILHNLSREKLIKVEGKTIHVHDPKRLRSYGQQ